MSSTALQSLSTAPISCLKQQRPKQQHRMIPATRIQQSIVNSWKPLVGRGDTVSAAVGIEKGGCKLPLSILAIIFPTTTYT
ncbi:unnamed protein product [Linum trigynum]|uniref:Uncharacterized protein n=1 Tax=Linum trigynum TaxID=586398 RepID=A0AAV2GJM1_9ROSI